MLFFGPAAAIVRKYNKYSVLTKKMPFAIIDLSKERGVEN